MDDKKKSQENISPARKNGRRLFGGGRVEMAADRSLHRLIARMPEFQQNYGLWLITGFHSHRSSTDGFERCVRRRFDFFSISHMYDGGGCLELNGVCRPVEPGNVVLICPGDENRYGGCNKLHYCEDAISFCGAIPELMRKKGLLRSGLYKGWPIRKLRPLIDLISEPALDQIMSVSLKLQEILLEFSRETNAAGDPLDMLLETIRQAPPEHWWRVSELAELRGVSPDTLRREFVARTGVLPKAYVEQFKLRQAAAMLINTNCPLAEAAACFGYMDVYHFSRRFKHLFGVSPDRYRKMLHRDRSK